MSHYLELSLILGGSISRNAKNDPAAIFFRLIQTYKESFHFRLH
jgi:hypothetical protein